MIYNVRADVGIGNSPLPLEQMVLLVVAPLDSMVTDIVGLYVILTLCSGNTDPLQIGENLVNSEIQNFRFAY